MHFYMLPGCRHLSRPHRRPYVEHYIALYIFIFLSFRCTAIQRNQKEEKYRWLDWSHLFKLWYEICLYFYSNYCCRVVRSKNEQDIDVLSLHSSHCWKWSSSRQEENFQPTTHIRDKQFRIELCRVEAIGNHAPLSRAAAAAVTATKPGYVHCKLSSTSDISNQGNGKSS